MEKDKKVHFDLTEDETEGLNYIINKINETNKAKLLEIKEEQKKRDDLIQVFLGDVLEKHKEDILKEIENKPRQRKYYCCFF
jgi:hypothetical protein